MKTIWKFELEITDRQDIEMPKKPEFLDAQFQNGKLCLWAIVDDDAPREKRSFKIYGTGNCANGAYKGYHIATVQEPDRPLVWHIFDCGGKVHLV